MPSPQSFRIRARIIIGASLLFLILLTLFLAIPLNHSIDDDIATLRVATFQAAISQRIAKDALELEGKDMGLQVQAIGELQTMLPIFENQQMQLSEQPTLPDIQPLLLMSQADFLSMDMAMRTLLANLSAPADPIEVQVILMHERTYFLDMSLISLMIEQEGEGDKVQLFGIELGLVSCLFLLLLLHQWETERQMRDILKRFRAIHGVVKK